MGHMNSVHSSCPIHNFVLQDRIAKLFGTTDYRNMTMTKKQATSYTVSPTISSYSN